MKRIRSAGKGSREARKGLRSVRKYWAAGRITLRSQFAYVGDTVLGLLFLGLIIFVFVYLWRATYGSQREIAGYSLPQMIWYLVLTETLVLAAPRLHLQVDADVKSGDLAFWLNKPVHYLGFQLAAFLAETGVRFIVALGIGGAVAGAMVGGFAFDWRAAGPVTVACLVSLLVTFLIAAAVGLSALWLEDVNGVHIVVDRIKWILGGLLLPVELLPGALQTVAANLPFPYLLNGPARLFVRFSWADFADLLWHQTLWLVVALAVCAWLWRRGTRRLNVNGG